MIILGMVAYYLFAIGLIAAVVLFALRQNIRNANAAFARLEADLCKWRESTPPLPPYHPAPIDDEPDEEEMPDLSTAALQPIAPLLARVAREYLAKPNERERLVLSLIRVLDAAPHDPT